MSCFARFAVFRFGRVKRSSFLGLSREEVGFDLDVEDVLEMSEESWEEKARLLDELIALPELRLWGRWL